MLLLRPAGRLSAAAGGGADPVDQHRHRGHADGEPGDGPARRRRDAAPAGAARRAAGRPPMLRAHGADGADRGGGRPSAGSPGGCGRARRSTLVRTETFTLLAMCQWFNVLNCQSASALGAAPGRAEQPLAARRPGAVGAAAGAGAVRAADERTLFHTVPLPAALAAAAAGGGQHRAVGRGACARSSRRCAVAVVDHATVGASLTAAALPAGDNAARSRHAWRRGAPALKETPHVQSTEMAAHRRDRPDRHRRRNAPLPAALIRPSHRSTAR